jgi:TPR repeat protein
MRREGEVSEWRVSRLQAAPSRFAEVARRGTEGAGAVAALMLALGFTLGFTLGVYREPIQQSAIRLAQSLGSARGAPSADAAYAAYQDRKYAVALRLARPLAEQGVAGDQSVLGRLYYSGQGVPQDYDEALKWFRRAADQDDAGAELALGVMYSEGQGVPQDRAEAASWFRRAADQGDARAQYNLGLSYADGEAGEQDNVSAHVWFNLAAAHFPASDPDSRSAAVTRRDLVARKMTANQIAEAEKRAAEWRPR